MASFFKPYAHFPGTRDQGRDSNRVFPKYEAGVLPPTAPNYLGISRDDTLRCNVNAIVAETHKHRTFEILAKRNFTITNNLEHRLMLTTSEL
jgi:hypothetical protein